MIDPEQDPFARDEDPSRAAPPLPSYQPPAGAAPAPDPADDAELRAMAVKRLDDIKGLRIHLTVYLAVMAFLTAIWMTTGGGYFWPIWPAMAWGLGLALHGLSLGWDKDPTEEQIAEQARRIAQKRGIPPQVRGPEGPQDTV